MKRVKPLLIAACSCMIAVAVALGVVELGLRLFFSLSINYDIEMFRYARLLKTPSEGARSHAHRPSSSARLMGVDVSINSHGFRDLERSYEKPRGTFRVLVLGDSLTFGWGVAFQDTYAHRLEEALNRPEEALDKSDGHGPASARPRIEVLNLGVGNYNTEQELAAFVEEGVRYQPDLVVLAFYINDAEPTQKHADGSWIEGSYALAFVKQRVNQLRGWLDPDFSYASYYKALYTGESWLRFSGAVHGLAEECRRRNVPLKPVLLPELHDLRAYPFVDEHRKVAALMRDEGLQPTDLLEDFAGLDGRPLWVAADDPHPNSIAHARIAEALLKRGTRDRWWP